MNPILSGADAAWLHMDRPNNSIVITSVLLFDEPLDWEAVREIVQTRFVDRHPRFRQRVVDHQPPLGFPHWEPDPEFALEHHLHHRALPAPGDDEALRELIADLVVMPLDHNRPLWHTYVIDGYGTGSAMVTRMHHCIGDGVALAQVMLGMTDGHDELAPSHHDHAGVLDVFGGLVGGVVGRVADAARSPRDWLASVARDGTTALRFLLAPADTDTPLKGEPGISRRVAWTRPLPLADVKATAHRHGATVNDVLLAGVTGALRSYLEAGGGARGEIQAFVPYNLRGPDGPRPGDLGNRFGLVLLPLPVTTTGRRRRLQEVHRRMGEFKSSRLAPVSYGLISAAGLTPEALERRIVARLSSKGTAVMTNVPGPRETMHLAGVPVRTVLVWAPTSGHIGMSVSIFSYRGHVTVGLLADAGHVPDPDTVIVALEHEIEALIALDAPAGAARV